MYNLSALQNASGFGEVLGVANDFSEGYLFSLLVIVIFVIIILAVPSEDFEIKIGLASFVCFFISMMLTYVGWLNFYYPVGFLIILAFDMLFIYTNR